VRRRYDAATFYYHTTLICRPILLLPVATSLRHALRHDMPFAFIDAIRYAIAIEMLTLLIRHAYAATLHAIRDTPAMMLLIRCCLRRAASDMRYAAAADAAP